MLLTLISGDKYGLNFRTNISIWATAHLPSPDPTFNSRDLISNSPYSLPNDSHYVSLESFVSVQLVIPKLIFFSFFSLLVWIIFYGHNEEKFCLGHSC